MMSVFIVLGDAKNVIIVLLVSNVKMDFFWKISNVCNVLVNARIANPFYNVLNAMMDIY